MIRGPEVTFLRVVFSEPFLGENTLVKTLVESSDDQRSSAQDNLEQDKPLKILKRKFLN